MAATAPTRTGPALEVERSTELWLLRAGSASEFDACRSAFGTAAPQVVLCPLGGEEERWAAALASACSAVLERSAALARAAEHEGLDALAERAWGPLGAALERRPAVLLAVLAREVLQAVAARALGLSAQGARALRVDPGRALLLRSGPAGLVLRRSNAQAPETCAGTALPDGRTGGAR